MDSRQREGLALDWGSALAQGRTMTVSLQYVYVGARWPTAIHTKAHAVEQGAQQLARVAGPQLARMALLQPVYQRQELGPAQTADSKQNRHLQHGRRHGRQYQS
jgi:hypothetical protein